MWIHSPGYLRLVINYIHIFLRCLSITLSSYKYLSCEWSAEINSTEEFRPEDSFNNQTENIVCIYSRFTQRGRQSNKQKQYELSLLSFDFICFLLRLISNFPQSKFPFILFPDFLFPWLDSNHAILYGIRLCAITKQFIWQCSNVHVCSCNLLNHFTVPPVLGHSLPGPLGQFINEH